ncbi:MAG: hypothetical protein ACREJM_09135, partial [Candidatus Saccharimonadales bacterium]
MINHHQRDDDVRRLGALRRLRRLDLSANSLTDESVAEALRLSWLEELGLARSDITDAGLTRLAELPKLARLRLAGSNVTLAAADRLIKRKPDLQLDAALGDALYQETWYLQATYRERNMRPLLMRELIFRCKTAARWKIACARLNNDPEALTDVYRQQIAWLKKYPPSIPGGSWPRERPIDVENGCMECAIAEAELLLTRTLGDLAAEKAAEDRTMRAARRLLRLTSSASIDPFEFDVARETGTRLLLAETPASEKPELQATMLAEDVDLFQSITDRTRALYDEGVRGGEAEQLAIVEIDLALARARLARSHGDRAGERLALNDAPSLAMDLSEAAQSAYEAG